ncbi:hypothetical protein PENANT_c001G02238 [Penicillium antarcticum]|uniref:Uncharacterized protein n=1 Tax=Penicillium antarcticum TaxID=416450 RepID=A0A1V6QN55_9EURO|nr:hypothetical protein PENANT_c001G02238 [Penicillium antarcticum]
MNTGQGMIKRMARPLKLEKTKMINVDQSAETGPSKYQSLDDATMMTRKRVALNMNRRFPRLFRLSKNESENEQAKRDESH